MAALLFGSWCSGSGVHDPFADRGACGGVVQGVDERGAVLGLVAVVA
jgi:hypothetical protein